MNIPFAQGNCEIKDTPRKILIYFPVHHEIAFLPPPSQNCFQTQDQCILHEMSRSK
jgi:hypothetical protein